MSRKQSAFPHFPGNQTESKENRDYLIKTATNKTSQQRRRIQNASNPIQKKNVRITRNRINKALFGCRESIIR